LLGSVGDIDAARLGFAGGALLGYRIGSFGVRVEALFSGRGAAFNTGDRNGSASIYYLEFPVLGELFFPLGSLPLEARVHAGTSIAYRLGGDVRDQNGADIDARLVTRSLDAGLVMGAGLAWMTAGQSALLLELRYQFGLLGIGEARDAISRMVVPNDAHSSLFSVLFGFAL
jgi:hypothetical protein